MRDAEKRFYKQCRREARGEGIWGCAILMSGVAFLSLWVIGEYMKPVVIYFSR